MTIDRQILFSAPMVSALLAGTKTQTRRILQRRPKEKGETFPVPFAVGDRLWVREAYFQFGHWEPIPGRTTPKRGRQRWRFAADQPDIIFDAPDDFRKGRHNAAPATPAWYRRLGRFMPRGASRLILTVTDMRLQRLQDISEEDAEAEGIERYRSPLGGIRFLNTQTDQPDFHSARDAFAHLWGTINGADAWAENPWVVALTFDVRKGNINGCS